MERLPDELLIMIFDYLNGRELMGCVSQVCRRWEAVVRLLALNVRRKEDTRALCGVRRVRLLTRIVPVEPLLMSHLRELTLYAATPISPEHYDALAQLYHLRHIDVFLRTRVLDSRLAPALRRLHVLVVNELIGTFALSALTEVFGFHMYGRALYFPRRELRQMLGVRHMFLRELTLRCTELQDIDYAAIGHCAVLQSLQLYSCWLLTAAGALLVVKPRRLRRLHVSGARLVRTQALTTMLGRLPLHMEELALSVSAFNDDHAELLQRLPALRVLELWRCRLTASAAVNMAKQMPSLRVLDLDILLNNYQINDLDNHSSLLDLRCLTEYSIRTNPYLPFNVCTVGESLKVVTKNIRVRPTNERFPYKYFRSCGEGYRGALYYYWTQDMDLEPVSNDVISIFDEDEDDY
jgi:hypothetical protein